MSELSRVETTKTNMGKKRSRTKKTKIIWFSLLGLLLVLLVGGVYAYIKLDQTISKIASNTEPKAEDDLLIDTEYTSNPFALLILGKDTRESDQGLNHTDVMIVAVVQPKEKHITLLSIPRDTRVVVPEFTGFKKITEAYAYGDNARIRAENKGEPIKITGISTAKKTVEGLLGIPIKNYITVDFEGFKKVIDELGGIEVDVERRLVYHDPTDGTSIDLNPGLQVLDGDQALDYVRHRHDDRGGKYYSNDFERNERQRLVISKVVDKVKSFTGVTHIFNLMDVAGDHIRTDLSKEQIKGLAFTFKSISSEDIQSLETKAAWDGRISFTVFPEDNLNEIRHTLWNLLNISEEEGKSRILEGSGLAKKSSTQSVSTKGKNKSTSGKTKSSSTASVSNNNNKTETEQNNQETETINMQPTPNSQPEQTNDSLNNEKQPDLISTPIEDSTTGETNADNGTNSVDSQNQNQTNIPPEGDQTTGTN